MNTNLNKIFVSFADSITNSTVQRVKFANIFDDIKNGKYSDVIEEIREIKYKKKRSLYKKEFLPYFSFSRFKGNQRKNDNFRNTNFLLIDVDDVLKINIYKKYFTWDNKVFCCFISPSGNGLKIIYKLSKTIENKFEYQLVYNYLRKELSRLFRNVDNTIDPARTCYLSYDPDIYLNGDCDELNIDEIIKPEKEKTKTEFLQKDIDLTILPSLIKFLTDKIDNHNDWIRLGFALASLGETGREYFVNLSLNNPKYYDSSEVINKKYDELLIKFEEEKISLGTLFYFAKEKGFDFKQNLIFKFWKAENGTMEINRTKFLEFLENNGYFKVNIQDKYYIVQNVDNRIKVVDIISIKDFVLNYLAENNFIDVREKMLRGVSQYFNEKIIESIRTKKLDFKYDTLDKSFAYFQNCYVEVTANSIELKEYSELDGVIWEKHIIPHNFEFTENKSDYCSFINNICRNEKERIRALRTSIGYLLHTHKDSANAKAIIFLDETIEDGANGRCGKSLIGQAIAKVRSVATADGRRFDTNDKFAYQNVNLDTQIVLFDDVESKFPFKKLYHLITAGLEIEKKNKDKIIIPFDKSPKYLITTNYVIKGQDGSDIARKNEIEFSDYYNKDYTPLNDFGKRFFDDWNEDDWHAFYLYMLKCLKLFLKYGLTSYHHINLEKKGLIEETSSEFVDFISKIDLKKSYYKKELYNQFIEEYEDFENSLKQNTFSKWIKEFCKTYGYKLKERFSSGNQIISFK